MHQLQHFTLNSSLSWRWAAEIDSLIFIFLRKLPFVFHNSTFGSLLSLFLTGCNFAQIANNVVDHGQVFRELRTAWNIVHVESFPILPALSHIWQLKIKLAPSLLTPWQPHYCGIRLYFGIFIDTINWGNMSPLWSNFQAISFWNTWDLEKMSKIPPKVLLTCGFSFKC